MMRTYFTADLDTLFLGITHQLYRFLGRAVTKVESCTGLLRQHDVTGYDHVLYGIGNTGYAKFL